MKPRFVSAIVVGASSGIGAEIVRRLVAEGTTVCAVARRADRLAALDGARPLVHDVTRLDEVPAAFETACRLAGGCDLLVYAAGVMPPVGAHEYDTAKDRAMFETNVLGGIAWLNETTRRFEETGRGAIVVIGSVAGDRGRRGQPGYNASKAAIATFAEALRNRFGGTAVTVCTIKPGPVATEMTAGLNLAGAMPVGEAAARIVRLADANGERYLKFSHRVVFAVIRLLPSWIFRRLPL